jgi:ATP-binding cassette subfamily B protein
MEEEVLGKAYDSRLMGRLLVYMRPYWKRVAIALVFLLVQSGLQVFGPLLTKVAIDRYIDPSAIRAPTFLDQILPSNPWSASPM